MKLNNYLYALLIGTALVLGCGDSNKDNQNTSPNANQGLNFPSSLNPDNNTQAPNNGNTEGQKPIDMQPVLSPQANTQPAANPNVKLNPPHGEPGHRCDIPVGSPLNSPPQQATTTTQPSTQQVTINPTTAPAPQTGSKTTDAAGNSNPKLNPPHGQPGHRCDIAVGAPLDGSPATNGTTPTVTPTTPATDNKNPLQYFQPAPKVDTSKKQ